MRDDRIRILAEMGLCIALFAILQYFSIQLPINLFGGSVHLAMVPIVVLALLRGPWVGLAVGALCGCVDLMIDPYISHPVQAVLDYPVAYAMVGSAGFLAPLFRRFMDARKTGVALAVAGVAALLGGFLRFVVHFISGIIFFGSFAPEGQNVWVYSILYNASYLLPSLVATIAVVLVVTPVLYSTIYKERGA
ncbi:MAG: energy-coupled thiamine transporter ThiT [Coriobacteriia bacterium]|nr:energy-coupled thiamine transporter ThiT [Coriobacteriia bacterium]